MDKKTTCCTIELEFDADTYQPKNLKIYVLSGRRGEDDAKEKGYSVEHVAFMFDYAFSKYGEIEAFRIPKPARKLLAKR